VLSSLKQQSTDRNIILIPSQPVLLFLHNAVCLAKKHKYQLYSLCFDQIGARIYDLPHSRRAH